MAEETKVETLDERIIREMGSDIPKVEAKVNPSYFHEVKKGDVFTGQQLIDVIRKIMSGNWDMKPAYERMDYAMKTVSRDDEGTGHSIRVYDRKIDDEEHAARCGDIGCMVTAGDKRDQVIRSDKAYCFGDIVFVAVPTVKPRFERLDDEDFYAKYTHDYLSELAKCVAYDLCELLKCAPKKMN